MARKADYERGSRADVKTTRRKGADSAHASYETHGPYSAKHLRIVAERRRLASSRRDAGRNPVER